MKLKELLVKYPSKEFGEVCVRMEHTLDYSVNDGLSYKSDKVTPIAELEVSEVKDWEFYLNHSCGDWDIGDKDKAEEMIENLKEAIAYVLANPKKQNE